MASLQSAEIFAQPDAKLLDVPAGSVSNVARRALTRFAPWLIIPVLLLAAGVRLWGIDAGLPLIYHPDEPNYIRIAQDIFKTGDLNPHLFNYPSLFFYLNALIYVPFYLGGKLLGTFHSRADIVGPGTPIGGVSLMLTTLPASVILGRLLTLFFSVGCVALVYAIGCRLTKKRAVGLLAALFMAVSTPAVVNGRTITPDTFVVFFVLFAFWGALQVFRHDKTWHYIVAGVGIGLAGGAKYNGALIAVAFVTAHFLRNGPKGFKDIRLYVASLLSVVTFFLTTPYALLDYSTFISDLQFEAQHYYNGHLGMEGGSFDYYLTYFRAVEGPVILFALIEIVRGFVTRQKTTILLSVFPLLYFLFIIQYTVRNDRTLLPLLPFAYILGALIAVAFVTAHFLRNGPKGFKDIRLYVASLLSVVTFFLTTPYALLDYSTFISDLQFEAQHYYNGHLGMEGGSFDYYLTYFRAVEGPVILFALIEIVRGFVTRQKTTILLSVFPLLYFLFIIQYTVRNDRTLLPLLPFAYILGALFLVRLAATQLLWVRQAWRPVARWALLGGLLIVTVVSLALPATTMAQATSSRLGGIESRQHAMAWIQENIPPGSRVAVESYTPYVDPQRYTLSGASSMADHQPEWYVQNADYLVFCKFTFRRYYDERDRFPTEVSRYEYMFTNFTELVVFPHEDYEIRIYKVPRK